MPASSELVAAFLASLAKSGCKASTIARRAAAIRYAHRLAGHDSPTSAETVRAVLRGIRRSIGTAPDRKTPATAELVGEILKHCPPTLAGKRDRALLTLGFAGAFRRSELVALTVADLVEAPAGLRVVIRRSKTDQEGEGQQIAIPRGYRLRPAEAVQTWLAAEINSGPVFRPVPKGSRVQPIALTHQSVAHIIKIHAERAGLEPSEFSGHSPAQRFPNQRGRGGRIGVQDDEISRHDGGIAAQVDGHPSRLRAQGGFIQGECRRSVPLIKRRGPRPVTERVVLAPIPDGPSYKVTLKLRPSICP